MAKAASQLIEPLWGVGAAVTPTRLGGPAAVEFAALPRAFQLQSEWTSLQSDSDHSFFQSWAWIGAWLHRLPAQVRPSLLRVRDGADTIGLGILAERTIWRRGLIRSRAVFLHATGRPEIDKLGIEHNGLLARRDCGERVNQLALEFLAREIACGRWDEAVLPGVAPAVLQAWDAVCSEYAPQLVVRRSPSHIVELDALRGAGGTVPDVFRQTLRKDIRRAMRRAEEVGPLQVDEAGSVDEALAFLDALMELHEARWQAAGERGAFSNPWLRTFHAALVAERFATGEIQLLRISAGDTPIGYLYNFIHAGRVYAYQWGLARQADRRIKVGLLADALALRHNLGKPAQVLDFLHGDSEYKRRFATASEERLWIVIQQRRLDFRVENALREFRRRQGWSQPVA